MAPDVAEIPNYAQVVVSCVTILDLRKTHKPTVVPDAGLQFQDIGDDSSDSGVDHMLD